MAPRLHQDILEEIEQIALFKYGALSHWGKNRKLALNGVIKKYKNRGEFLKIKNMYDQSGLFFPEWTDQIIGLRNGVTTHDIEGRVFFGRIVYLLTRHSLCSK
ncbi:hypothetical protein CRYUN_Cryun14cG0053400 [Craigia yunnanensis]